MNKDGLGYITNGIAIIFSAVQTNELFSIISWVLTILATLVTIAYTLWKWWRRAKADGKITPEEIEEGLEITKEGLDNLTKKGNKDDGKKD